tara:strand:+ start:488 stop:1339 length:852 start_codon:yes stop_codon:yes gene_type:complete
MFQKIVNISIVCASAKGKLKLPSLIKSISEGSYLPNELIIVGTSLSDIQLSRSYINKKIKFKFLISKINNQIYQRNMGKKISKNNLILQTDDDVIFKKNTLKEFYYNSFFSPKKKILASYVIDENNSHQSIRFSRIYNKSFIFRLILRFLNNFKKINNFSLIQSGRIVPLIIKNSSRKYENVDWLNSVMMYNKNLVSEPKNSILSKKSYYEDVLFSNYNKLKGFKLIILKNAKIIHPTINKTNLKVFLNTLEKQFYLVKILKKSYILFIIDVIIFSVIFSIYK